MKKISWLVAPLVIGVLAVSLLVARQVIFTPVNPTSTDTSLTGSGLEYEQLEAQSASSQESLRQPVREEVANGTIIDEGGLEYPNQRYELFLDPNDPLADQWWLDEISLNEAWDTGTGSSGTLIAIIDTGFDLAHQEFSGRWYENPGESGAAASENPSQLNCTDQTLPLDRSCNNIDDDFDGIVDNESGTTTRENPSRLNCTDQALPLDKSCNLIDDDGNGLADDIAGWDFANFDQVVEAGETDPNGDATDHGTMVAGIAGATGNNGVGIAGVNWGATLLPVQVFNDEGYGDTITVSRAIRYAAAQGADIISLSLGTGSYDSYLRGAVEDAIEAGSLVVAASGNDGCNCISYPANFPEVVAVGAINTGGTRASFSSYGANLDVVAPGVSMTTPTWSQSSNSLYASGVNGTSFATPLVSGLLGLLRDAQPDATWAELVSVLTESTDRVNLAGSQFSAQYGFGNANALTALTRANTPLSLGTEYRYFPLSLDDVISSARTYQCEGQPAGTRLYQLSRDNINFYTVSELQRAERMASGWTSSFLGYHCLSLPTDTPGAVRTINLQSEINNGQSTKASY